MIPLLALRNVLRNRRRSLLSGSVVFFGVFFLIASLGFIDGIEYGSVKTQIDTNCADVRILAAGYDDKGFDLPLVPHLADARVPLARAATLPGFVAAAPRLRFSADLSDGRDQLRVVAIGVDPTADAGVFAMAADEQGLSADPPGILLGSGIAKLFETGPGEMLTVVARTPAGAISALDFVVKGVVATGNPAVDNLQVLIPIASARTLLAFGPAEATEVAIKLRSQRITDKAVSALAHGLPATEQIETWVEATEDVRALMRVRRKGIAIVVTVIMAIAAAGIANTVLMSVYERFREIGTLLAFGFPPRWVRLMFLLEGIELGLIGSLAGVLCGGAVVYYFERTGIDLTALTSSPASVYPMPTVIYMELTAAGLLRSGGFGVLVAALATLLPARRAALLDPVEALHA